MPSRRGFLLAGLGAGAVVIARSGENVASFPEPATLKKHDVVPKDSKSTPGARERADEFLQPDYHKWAEIKQGMTKADVIKLLGKPLEDDEVELRARLRKEGKSETEVKEYFESLGDKIAFDLTYGRIKYESAVIPDEYEFLVRIQNEKVLQKVDPFNGRLSRDGGPTVPDLLLPNEKTLFQYFPRFLDFRWSPASGVYPMEYEIEVSIGHWQQTGTKYDPTLYRSPFPYLAISFGGANPGRWRVRAGNRLGKSEWTPFRYFKCKI